MDLLELRPARMLDVIYSLLVEDTKEAAEGRRSIDAQLDAAASRPVTGKPDRETWGRLPSQQRAMRAATQIQV